MSPTIIKENPFYSPTVNERFSSHDRVVFWVTDLVLQSSVTWSCRQNPFSNVEFQLEGLWFSSRGLHRSNVVVFLTSAYLRVVSTAPASWLGFHRLNNFRFSCVISQSGCVSCCRDCVFHPRLCFQFSFDAEGPLVLFLIRYQTFVDGMFRIFSFCGLAAGARFFCWRESVFSLTVENYGFSKTPPLPAAFSRSTKRILPYT